MEIKLIFLLVISNKQHYLSIFDMYKGVIVYGYLRVCNHVDIRT